MPDDPKKKWPYNMPPKPPNVVRTEAGDFIGRKKQFDQEVRSEIMERLAAPGGAQPEPPKTAPSLRALQDAKTSPFYEPVARRETPEPPTNDSDSSLGHRLGFAGLIVTLASIGLFYWFPNDKWIGSLSFIAAAILFLCWIVYEVRNRLSRQMSLLTAIIVGIVLGGGMGVIVWWGMVAKPTASTPTASAGSQSPSSRTESEIAADFAARKAQRHDVRNRMADLIARGRLFQNQIRFVGSNGNHLGAARLEQMVKGFAGDVPNWHMDVISFVEHNVTHADAMRLMVPGSTGYPPGVAGWHSHQNPNFGYNLEQSWDMLTSDIAALEEFLRTMPEL